MSFIDEQLEAQRQITPELEVVPDEVEVAQEEVPAAEVTQQEPAEDPTPTFEKLKIDYNEWLSSNEDTLYKYLSEKKTDYSSLKQEELVALKLKKDNPEFSEQDIKEELADKYGIGLDKVNIDRDEMTNEEITEAEKFNKDIDRKMRQLKKDAPAYLNEFNSQKESVTLPDFEYEVPTTQKEAKLTDDEVATQVQEQTNKHREEIWIPELTKAIETIPSVKKNVEFEYNGETYTVEVDYKLSDQEKKDSVSELSYYIPSQKDQEKYQDVQGFVQDKISSLMEDKLLKTVAKEVAATVLQKYVKEKVVNYDDSGRRQAVRASGDGDFAANFFQKNSQKINNL